jgi:hypothetical protein
MVGSDLLNLLNVLKDHQRLVAIGTLVVATAALVVGDARVPIDILGALEGLSSLVDARGHIPTIAFDALWVVVCLSLIVRIADTTGLHVVRTLHQATPLWIKTSRRLRAARTKSRKQASRRRASRHSSKARRANETTWAPSLFGRPVIQSPSPYYCHE